MTEKAMNSQTAPGEGLLEPGADDAPDSLLFVDDERNILSSLRRLFRPLGYTIHVAESGAEGLKILAEHPIDLIISDMRMPEMDGAQFLAEATKRHPDVVRILLTGFADLGSTVDAINKGKIYSYLSKPWEDTEITLTVRQALKTKRLEREKQQLLALTERQNNELKDLNENLEKKVKARTEEVQQTADMLDMAYQQLSDSYQNTIRVFSSLISMRESLSGRYGQKIADLARKMALAMKMDTESVREVYFAALLHELGKLSLPDYLLDRPAFTLNRQGRDQYQRHPINGQTVLMAVDELQGTANLIRAHEEYFDGSGFPDGSRGESIPLGARIISLAKDFYGYQSGKLLTNTLTARAAMDRIEAESGKKYDPKLVKLLAIIVGRQQEEKPDIREKRLSLDELSAGMKLSRDLFNHADMLLLTKGRTLTELHLRKLAQLEKAEDHPFEFHVYEVGK